MNQYLPPINERESNELWLIAIDDGTEWKKEAIDQATQELIRRGATNQEFINNKTDNIEFKKRLTKLNLDIIENRKNESYSKAEMLTILVLAPLYIINKFPSSKSLFELKSEQYNLKFRQRLMLLTIGSILWVTILFIAMKVNSN